jgi:hypothetical protein
MRLPDSTLNFSSWGSHFGCATMPAPRRAVLAPRCPHRARFQPLTSSRGRFIGRRISLRFSRRRLHHAVRLVQSHQRGLAWRIDAAAFDFASAFPGAASFSSQKGASLPVSVSTGRFIGRRIPLRFGSRPHCVNYSFFPNLFVIESYACGSFSFKLDCINASFAAGVLISISALEQ